MLFRPSVPRRAILLTADVAIFSGLVAAPIIAANTTVSGSLTYVEKVSLSSSAVAIVTIVDQTAASNAGAIVGQQRIDGPTALPIDFAVLVDAGAIDPIHAYALFATIVDGTRTWENRVGTPFITGGPTKGIDLLLTAMPAKPLATVTGTIVPPTGAKLSPSAVAIAALIKVGTGTLVARQVVPVNDPTNLAFAIGFDPALIDPTATYVVKGGLVDGSAVWENRAGVTAIDKGVATGPVTVPVTAAPTGLPAATPAPTAKPTPAADPPSDPAVPPADSTTLS